MDFINFIYPFGHGIIVIIELMILLFTYPFFTRSNNWAMYIFPIILISTIYDNLILLSGQFIGQGELLKTLSQVRYFLHYIVIPLFIIVAIELAYRSDAKWANRWVRVSSWLLALILAGFDIINNFMELTLKPEIFAGILRYVSVNPNPPIITIMVNVFVLLVGIGIWVRTKNWRLLFWGALISLIGNGIPSALVGTLPSSTSEVFLEISLLLTQYYLTDQPDKTDALTTQVKCPDGWNVTEYSGYQVFWKEETNYTIYQTGSHQEGDFIRIYAPKNPYQENGKFKVITYLHGFALGLPKFYEQHLETLVKEGYYVFFPDYQTSDYPNFVEDSKHEPVVRDRITLRYWLLRSGTLLIRLISQRPINEETYRDCFDLDQSIWRSLRLLIGISAFIIGANIVYLFNRKYGNSLISMITTVIASLNQTPKHWLSFAIKITAIGWDKLCEYSQQVQKPDLDLSEKEIDFYLFGHSLGGLLALSWIASLLEQDKSELGEKLAIFYPKQIIVADPAPNTTMGIPKLALGILGIFRFPFATQPLDIKNTGEKLDIPVGILHGNDDRIVKATEWVKPPRSKQKGAFFEIASTAKNIYFSQSNKTKNLRANHNQAVTDTTYYENAFMAKFGGAKEDANAYNFQYIWPALTAIIQGQVNADQLDNNSGFKLKDFEVLDEPKLKICRLLNSLKKFGNQ